MTKTLNQIKQCTLVALFLSFSFSSIASTSEVVEVRFSEHLDKQMERISKIDRRREKAARQHLENFSVGDCVNVLSSTCFFSDVEDYTVPSLITKMMEAGIKEANPEGFEGHVVLEVDKLFVEVFPIARVNSFNTRMEGTVKQFDQQGNLVAEREVWTLLKHNKFGVDVRARISPIAGQFVTKALGKIFPSQDVPSKMFL